MAPPFANGRALTEMEVAYELLLNPRLARRLKPVMDAFFGSIRVLPYDRKAAEATARRVADLERRGRPIGYTSRADRWDRPCPTELILVTSNVRELKQVEGLRLDDWRS
jgi:predicted nucleic acid-binding protein